MQINVSQLLKEPIGSIRNYQVNETIDIAGDESMVRGKVKLLQTNHSILAKGTLRLEIKVICSRCLNLFNCPLTVNIGEEYFPTTDVDSGASLALPEEPDSFTIDEHHVLDLTEAIRQYVILATPMKPLCRQDCAGLQPQS